MQVSGFADSRQAVYSSVAEVQREMGHGGLPWQVYFYPDTDTWGIVEIILKE